MTATVLSPRGKLKVETRKPKKEEMEIAFTAVEEGKILLFRFDKFSLDLWKKTQKQTNKMQEYIKALYKIE